MDDTWAIVLAAGASTRMKTPKMLLPFNGETIIETVILKILEAHIKNILIVLGSHKNKIEKQIAKFSVKTCLNENFMNGMLSSVQSGFGSLPSTAKAALVLLGDQPNVKSEVMNLLIREWNRSGKGISIPVFNGRRGHPILIETRYRREIMNLDPQKGLRELIEKFSDDICEVECRSSEILRDIDTPEDYIIEINLKN